MRLLAVILLLPAALVVWQWWSDARAEARLRPVASAISGRKIEVDCQSWFGHLIDAQSRHGEVRFGPDGIPETRIFLTHPTCERLADFAGKRHHVELDCLAHVEWSGPAPLPLDSDCYRRSSADVYALLTLAHESYHTAGVIDEATTNCYAIQSMAWAASALGASEPEAERLALAMVALAPHQRSPYATSNCRANTQLDLHPETPAFPTERPLAPPRGLGGSIAARP